jgi:cullin-associated NEDD8-dissociated protein 1
MKADFASHRRYMSLNDLMTEIRTDAASFLGDEAIENKVLNQVLQLVEDKISEVKNQAVKWCIYLPVI